MTNETLGDLDRFTADELGALHLQAYRWAVRFYEAAVPLFEEMRLLGTWTHAYKALDAKAGILMAAGAEQSELSGAIFAELEARRA